MVTESLAAAIHDFGDEITLRKADGSVALSSAGFYDEAETEYETERGIMRSRQPQISVFAADAAQFEEGDEIDHLGDTYEILDQLKDKTVVTFNVGKN